MTNCDHRVFRVGNSLLATNCCQEEKMRPRILLAPAYSALALGGHTTLLAASPAR